MVQGKQGLLKAIGNREVDAGLECCPLICVDGFVCSRLISMVETAG